MGNILADLFLYVSAGFFKCADKCRADILYPAPSGSGAQRLLSIPDRNVPFFSEETSAHPLPDHLLILSAHTGISCIAHRLYPFYHTEYLILLRSSHLFRMYVYFLYLDPETPGKASCQLFYHWLGHVHQSLRIFAGTFVACHCRLFPWNFYCERPDSNPYHHLFQKAPVRRYPAVSPLPSSCGKFFGLYVFV